MLGSWPTPFSFASLTWHIATLMTYRSVDVQTSVNDSSNNNKKTQTLVQFFCVSVPMNFWQCGSYSTMYECIKYANCQPFSFSTTVRTWIIEFFLFQPKEKKIYLNFLQQQLLLRYSGLCEMLGEEGRASTWNGWQQLGPKIRIYAWVKTRNTQTDEGRMKWKAANSSSVVRGEQLVKHFHFASR